MNSDCCDAAAALLGILGDRAWFRCLDCGLDFSTNAADLDEQALAITFGAFDA